MGSLVLFLFVQSNLYIAIYVQGVTSWIVLLTPVPKSPDTCVQELGDVAASAGRTVGRSLQYMICLFFQMTVSF